MQYWDPLRKKNVAATPEEQVRQWFIMQLRDAFGVPEHMMMSETGFKSGGKQYRADILVYDRSGKALAVVECKRPEVEMSATVAEQAMRYNAVLGVRYLFVTNGRSTCAAVREGERFVFMDHLPPYEEMIENQMIL